MIGALRLSVVVLSLVGVLVLAGCASSGSSSEKSAKPKKEKSKSVMVPSKVKFGEFAQVELKPFGIAPKHAEHEGNQKSAKIMDEMLQRELKNIFPNLKVLAAGAEFSKSDARTLQIAPFIKDIRLISTGTRIWLGAMAGGSDITVTVTYKDSASGEVIAEPVIVKGISGWTDAWGAGSNQLRDEICRDIAFYTLSNK